MRPCGIVTWGICVRFNRVDKTKQEVQFSVKCAMAFGGGVTALEYKRATFAFAPSIRVHSGIVFFFFLPGHLCDLFASIFRSNQLFVSRFAVIPLFCFIYICSLPPCHDCHDCSIIIRLSLLCHVGYRCFDPRSPICSVPLDAVVSAINGMNRVAYANVSIASWMLCRLSMGMNEPCHVMSINQSSWMLYGFSMGWTNRVT